MDDTIHSADSWDHPRMLHLLGRASTVRFVIVGLAMTGLHLLIFRLLSPLTIPEVANSGAFVLATQANFLLSYHWTWSARRPAGREPVGRVLRRALVFNASAVVAFLANAAVFFVAHRGIEVEPFPSAIIATAASAAVSFLVSSRITFAHRAPDALPEPPGAWLDPVVQPSLHTADQGDRS